jgi:hypothetical protein
MTEPRRGRIRQLIDLLCGSMPADFESVSALDESGRRLSAATRRSEFSALNLAKPRREGLRAARVPAACDPIRWEPVQTILIGAFSTARARPSSNRALAELYKTGSDRYIFLGA